MEQAIETSVSLCAPLGRVRAVLAADPGIVVAATDAGHRRDHPFHAVLELDLGAGAAVRQEVLAEVGAVRTTEDGVAVKVSWTPAGHERMFPTFAGEVVATEERPGVRLTLKGFYTIPLGWVGRASDSVAGRKLAQRVLADHMGTVAERLAEAVTLQAAAVAERLTETATRRAFAVPDRRAEPVAGPGSENFIG